MWGHELQFPCQSQWSVPCYVTSASLDVILVNHCHTLIAGIACAGMSATYPLDMVRGRLTVQSIQGSHRYRGIMHATSVIIKEASPCST